MATNNSHLGTGETPANARCPVLFVCSVRSARTLFVFVWFDLFVRFVLFVAYSVGTSDFFLRRVN